MSILKTSVENLASQLAAHKGGCITPNDLLPYLPISLDHACQHLSEMSDGSVVIENTDGDLRTYEFPEFLGRATRPVGSSTCIACQIDLPATGPPRLCGRCEDALGGELMQLAENTAWPAAAVKEHEILFITASAEGPITVASVVGHSRLTLKKLQDELKDLAQRKSARAVLDETHGILTYEFPRIDYDQSQFARNDRFIRGHPSSLKDEVEVRLIRMMSVVAAIVVVCIVLAFFRINFRLLLLAGLIAAAISGLRIFTAKDKVTPEQL